MRKNFETPDLQISKFSIEHIVMTSGTSVTAQDNVMSKMGVDNNKVEITSWDVMVSL